MVVSLKEKDLFFDNAFKAKVEFFHLLFLSNKRNKC